MMPIWFLQSLYSNDFACGGNPPYWFAETQTETAGFVESQVSQPGMVAVQVNDGEGAG